MGETTIPFLLTHPETAKMANRLRAEWHELLWQTVKASVDPKQFFSIIDKETPLVNHLYTLLLSDLSRPESRDAWVRWLAAREPLESRRYSHWHAIRNDPSALLAAIREVTS